MWGGGGGKGGKLKGEQIHIWPELVIFVFWPSVFQDFGCVLCCVCPLSVVFVSLSCLCFFSLWGSVR